ncbi:transcriptional regulator [Terribacillus saccharophilus]|uniref:DUF2087 domain-containing protein n=1 Tax=Terribacillus saccharophilus TaxID=361277 RepID=UPI000BA6F93D|nr:DUF2087 domain-containing protein [Terribacillus saccharophilus]PAF21216.1 transcriptional regulator [Terribacillus saccharophilus]PAF36417.1 transcriptional regulator [Terribacillus saccharophilus]
MKYSFTEKERNQVLSNFMKDGKVINVPAKEKKKYILSAEFTKKFDEGKIYSEQDINAELLTMYSKDDYVEQRRYLITFELFKRTSDGTQYWLNSDNKEEIAK